MPNFITAEAAAKQLENLAEDLRAVGGMVKFTIKFQFDPPSGEGELRRLTAQVASGDPPQRKREH